MVTGVVFLVLGTVLSGWTCRLYHRIGRAIDEGRYGPAGATVTFLTAVGLPSRPPGLRSRYTVSAHSLCGNFSLGLRGMSRIICPRCRGRTDPQEPGGNGGRNRAGRRR
jgi:hypothetical protein